MPPKTTHSSLLAIVVAASVCIPLTVLAQPKNAGTQKDSPSVQALPNRTELRSDSQWSARSLLGAANSLTPASLQAKLLPAVYVRAAALDPIGFLKHRIAAASVADARSFSASSDKAGWIKHYLRDQSGLAAYVGTGSDPGTEDLLAFIARSSQYIGSNAFDDKTLEVLVTLYISNSGDRVKEFASALLARISNDAQNDKALRALYLETVGSNPTYPAPDASLADIVAHHQKAFATTGRVYFGKLPTVDQLASFRSYSELADKLAHYSPTGEEIASDGANELNEAFLKGIDDARAAPPDDRKQIIADATGATQITEALIELRDPQAAKSFKPIADNGFKLFFAVEGMAEAGALSMSGVGAVFVAAVGIFEAMQPHPADQNNQKILQFEAKILLAIRELRADILALQSMVSELYAWLDRGQLNDEIGFQTIQNQLYDLQDQLALSTAKLSESIRQAMLQGPRQDYSTGSFFMINPSQRDLALSIISKRGDPAYVQYAALLARISDFGLEATRREPFVDKSPWSGEGLKSIAAAPWDMRVGDLSGLLALLPSGTTDQLGIVSSDLAGRPNPAAWAWTVQMYVDLARWVPEAGGPDSVLAQECLEAQKVERMGTDLRKLVAILRPRYEDAARSLASAIDGFTQDKVKARIAENPWVKSALIDLGRDGFNPQGEDLKILIDYDPDKAPDVPAVLIQAFARGLLDHKVSYQLQNVHLAFYWEQVNGVPRLRDNGWVEGIGCGGGFCSYQGYTFDCLEADDAFYLTAAGAAIMGGAPGDRIYPLKKYRQCGFQSQMANNHLTDFVRKTDTELRALMNSWTQGHSIETDGNEVPLPQADASLSQQHFPRIKKAIRSYDLSWQQDIVNDFHLQASFTTATKIGRAAQTHEAARLSLTTALQLGIAACPANPKLLDAVGAGEDDGIATRLPSAASVDDIRTLVDRFSKSAAAPTDQDGKPIDIPTAVNSCVPGPKGLANVAQLLNSVSSSYSDRLPNGCPMDVKSFGGLLSDTLSRATLRQRLSRNGMLVR